MKTNYIITLLSIILLGLITLSCSKDDGSGNAYKLNTGQIELKAYPNISNKIAFKATAKKISIDWGDGKVDELSPNGIDRVFTHEYGNQSLRTILISTEDLSYISFSSIELLELLNHDYIHYKELRFGRCPLLKGAMSVYPTLTLLEIYKTPLTELRCDWGGQLTSLSVIECTELIELRCYGNQLTSLDVSGCTALKTLLCSGNKLSTQALNSLFESLPKFTLPTFEDEIECEDPPCGIRQITKPSICCNNNPGYSDCDISIATRKEWNIQHCF